MYLPLLIRFLTHVNVAASEHEIISALILTICASKFEILDKVKDKLTATKLSDFTGENINLYCDNQLGIFQ